MNEIESELFKNPEKDTRSRKHLLTINNPKDHNMSHEKIKNTIETEINHVIYYCMSDEIGLEDKTYHTHIFICSRDTIYFSRMKKLFPSANIKQCNGTPLQVKDYVFKEGKYLNDPKGETNLRDTHEEFGECPKKQPGKRIDLIDIRQAVDDELTLDDFINTYPDLRDSFHIQQFEFLRAKYYQQKSKNNRKIQVCYVYGEPGTGKTSSIIEKCNQENLRYYKVQDYTHSFDNYDYEEVLILDEYVGGFKIQQLNNFLDIYQCQLDCRYTNKYAMWTKVYIISNKHLDDIYINPKIEIMKSLYRRINFYYSYTNNTIFKYHVSSVDCYELTEYHDYTDNGNIKTKINIKLDKQHFIQEENIYSTVYRVSHSTSEESIDWM